MTFGILMSNKIELLIQINLKIRANNPNVDSFRMFILLTDVNRALQRNLSLNNILNDVIINEEIAMLINFLSFVNQ